MEDVPHAFRAFKRGLAAVLAGAEAHDNHLFWGGGGGGLWVEEMKGGEWVEGEEGGLIEFIGGWVGGWVGLPSLDSCQC